LESIDPVEVEAGDNWMDLVGIDVIFRVDRDRTSAAGLMSLVDRCIFASLPYCSMFEYVV